jgi:aspartate/methionine/tyrosine aminotransferase
MSDMQLIRSHEPGTHNLAIGEPFFLQPHLWWATAIAPEGPFCYPHSRGEPELLQELQRAYQGMHVVVTNGAKQAISAVAQAYASVYYSDHATHETPYWPSYPYLVAKELEHGLNPLNVPNVYKKKVCIITSPNNPDGVESSGDCDIWDAAYAHPVYGFTTPPSHWTVAIYSAAKLFGLSGLRVGWIVTADAKLAEHVTTYVERYTSGVCVTAQRHLAAVLKHVRIHDEHESWNKARESLLENGRTFNHYLESHVDALDGVPVTGKGMFAWFHVKDEGKFREALVNSKVRLVDGASCGMPLYSAWYRMSMGHHELETTRAIQALAKALQT